MEINHVLTRKQADELFDAEAVFMCGADAIPEYRIIELFGESFVQWIDECDRHDGHLKGGADPNCAFDETHRIFRWFYKPGFYKIVSKANLVMLEAAHKSSETGKLIDAAWEDRCRCLADIEAENERKKAERKAKRAAAKAAKEATV